MKILLTGASGFLGQSIYNELSLANEMVTLSRNGAALNIDLAREVPELPDIDLVVHSAGKAHSMPKTESEKQEFFDVNLKGTQNLLKGLEQSTYLPNSFVFISSVAVYGLDSANQVTETSPLLALDPYGLSKIEAEKSVLDWCSANRVVCTILRLPLLAGPNPPGNLQSMIKGIKNGYYFNIENGKAKKSIVLANDVAKILTEVSSIGGIYNLTDGYHPSFSELSESIAFQLNKSKPRNMPSVLIRGVGLLGDIIGSNFINSAKFKKMANDLTFSDLKARNVFGWNPQNVLKKFKI